MTKRALVTGATGGLGKSLCTHLVESGYHVFGVGRNLGDLSYLAGIGAEMLKADLREIGASEKIIQKFPDVDVLVNNAGIFPIKKLTSSSIGDYDETFTVNVRVPFQLMSHYIPKMRDRRSGSVINILSSSAFSGSPDTGLYCASKHALLGLTRSSFLENRGTGVNVYSVSPGSMKTKMGKTDTSQDFNTFLDPTEVAEYILFCCKFQNEMFIEESRMNRISVV